MKKHHYAFLALLSGLGAVAGLVIAVYGFVTWAKTGFVLEDKYSTPVPGLEAFVVSMAGVAAFFWCAHHAGIGSHESQDETAKRSRETKGDDA